MGFVFFFFFFHQQNGLIWKLVQTQLFYITMGLATLHMIFNVQIGIITTSQRDGFFHTQNYLILDFKGASYFLPCIESRLWFSYQDGTCVEHEFLLVSVLVYVVLSHFGEVILPPDPFSLVLTSHGILPSASRDHSFWASCYNLSVVGNST